MGDIKNLKLRVGFIGAGNMASALVRGMIKQGLAPEHVFVCDLDKTKVHALVAELGVEGVDDNQTLASSADVVILAAKPQAVVDAATDLGAVLGDRAKEKLWLSVAAGVSTHTLEGVLGAGARVVRAMPNTPALILEAATAFCAGKHATHDDIVHASTLLRAVGRASEVSESMMDAVTGLSGSGPAYVMLLIEAMADGAVRAGLPRQLALDLAAQTVKGAACLVLETGKHPAELKDMVTSPGGTTIAGVEALEAHGFRSALISAVTAATKRSAELSKK